MFMLRPTWTVQNSLEGLIGDELLLSHCFILINFNIPYKIIQNYDTEKSDFLIKL